MMPDHEDEDLDPVGAPRRDPIERITEAAVRHGLIRPGDKLDQNMLDWAAEIIGMAAEIGDAYGDGSEGNAGEHIRTDLWDV